MMNKKMWGGETRPNYVAPSFEEFNVAVEEGFAVSDPQNGWSTDESIDYNDEVEIPY